MAAGDGDEDGAEQDCDKHEVKEVGEILKKFVISSETSSGLDTIDIILMMKALPQKITESDLHLKYMFNFVYTQDSLLAYRNEDQVMAFEYYDTLNSKRVTKIRQCIATQRDNLLCVQTIMECIRKQIEHQETTIASIKNIWAELDRAKKQRLRDRQKANDQLSAEKFRK